MRKFVIIGSTLSGNKGAAAMLESAVQTLGERFPESQFTLLSYLPVERERLLNSYKNLTVLKASPLYLGLVINPLALLHRVLPPLRPLLRKNPQINALASADILLDQGGITFVDGREKFLLYNIASILPAILLNTKVVKCAQALGPFNNPVNHLAAKIFLPKMAAIISRGSVTHQHLEGLGLKNVYAGADYAFLLELSEAEKRAAMADYKQFFKDSVVGISPSVVMRKKVDASGKDYIGILAEFIDGLIAEGKRVVIIPHSVRVGTDKTHNNDLPLCRELYEHITQKTNCLLIDDELSSQQLRAIIGECSFFVASRFHAMVSSLAMQVPTLVIGWSHKYKEVLEMFELEDWAFGQEKLSAEYLQQQFHALTKNEATIQSLLKKNLPAVKSLALKQVEVIEKIEGRS